MIAARASLARRRLGEGAACWFESLAVASRPLQRRLAETNFEFPFEFRSHHKPLVSWNWVWAWYNSGRVRDPVKPLVLIQDRDRSVSVIRTLPLAVDKTRTVTGATKPAAQGQCRLGQLALQAGVI